MHKNIMENFELLKKIKKLPQSLMQTTQPNRVGFIFPSLIEFVIVHH